MVAFPLIGVVAGIVLGLRFKISIFVPTISFTGAAVVLFGLAGGHEPRMIALALFAAVVSLQIGYIVGKIAVSTQTRTDAKRGFPRRALAARTPTLPA
jgi:hypothetical protein